MPATRLMAALSRVQRLIPRLAHSDIMMSMVLRADLTSFPERISVPARSNASSIRVRIVGLNVAVPDVGIRSSSGDA